MDGVICIPAALTADDIEWGERIFILVCFIVLAFAGGMICWKGFTMKAGETKRNRSHGKSTVPAAKPTEWMTSQLPALYLQENHMVYRDDYIRRLESIGFEKRDAEKMFDFESEIIRKHGKQYLLNPTFTKLCFSALKSHSSNSIPKRGKIFLKRDI